MRLTSSDPATSRRSTSSPPSTLRPSRSSAATPRARLPSCYFSYSLRSRFSLFHSLTSSPLSVLLTLRDLRTSDITSLIVLCCDRVPCLDIYRIVSTRQVGDSHGPSSAVILPPTLPDPATDRAPCCSAL